MPGMFDMDQMSEEYGYPSNKKQTPDIIVDPDFMKELDSLDDNTGEESLPCPEGCHPKNYTQYRSQVERFLDEVQAHIVVAGGRKFSIEEISDMSVGQLLFMCLPNSLEFSVRLTKLRPKEQ